MNPVTHLRAYLARRRKARLVKLYRDLGRIDREMTRGRLPKREFNVQVGRES